MRPAQFARLATLMGADRDQRDAASVKVLFILCPPRTYSSVICAMLGQHPDCYAFPELALFVSDTIQGLLDFHSAHCRGLWTAAHCSPGLIRALAQLHDGAQTKETADRAISWISQRRDWTTRRMLDYLLSRIQPAIGIDKSPLTPLFSDFLARAGSWYPQARFLHLTRHPVSSHRSLVRHFRARLLRVHPDWDDAAIARFFAELWCRAHRNILDLTRQLPPCQAMRVQGESVLMNPSRELARIARWLGVSDDPEALDDMKHPERSPYAHFGPGIARGANDPQFLESPRLRRIVPSVACEFPPDCHLTGELESEMVDLAMQLGYSVRQRHGAAA